MVLPMALPPNDYDFFSIRFECSIGGTEKSGHDIFILNIQTSPEIRIFGVNSLQPLERIQMINAQSQGASWVRGYHAPDKLPRRRADRHNGRSLRASLFSGSTSVYDSCCPMMLFTIPSSSAPPWVHLA